MSKLKIVYKHVDEIIPYVNNPRKISQNAIDKVASSIKNFGFKVPIIIDKDNEIVAGHNRMLAAKKLGMEEVPCIVADDLTEAQIKAFRIADNRTAEFAEWDFELLEIELEGLDDEFTGFDMKELDDMFPDDTEVIEDDFDEEPPEEPISKRGDIWLLGRHKLMCGDCTSREDIKILMAEEKADMLFTDPPYGVNYTGGHFHSGDVNIKRPREKLIADDTANIYREFLPVVLPFVDGPCYMWFAGTKGREVYNALHENNTEIHALLIWHKVNAKYAAMNAQYKQRHEPCLYFKPKGSTLRWIGPTTESTVWEIKRDAVNEYHPTQKPISLAAKAIKNHDVRVVLDVFGGSGSTLVACEQLDRICYMMELDEKYVDVIVDRYINYKGGSTDVYLVRDGEKTPYNEVVNM